MVAGYTIVFPNPTISNCTFIKNSSVLSGGGIFNNEAIPTIDGCTFIENKAEAGAGMFNSYANPILMNCTFIGNVAENYGGGIANSSMNQYRYDAIIINCTFSGNVAANYGSGISNVDTSPTFINCIVWSNLESEQIRNKNSSPRIVHSIVEGGYEGIGNLATDPLLMPLGNYSGFVQAMPVEDGSSAIVAGMTQSQADAFFGEGVMSIPMTDATGRIRKTPCTIGAVESTAYPIRISVHEGGNYFAPEEAFTLEVSGTPNDAEYQWFKNGVKIVGETDAVLTISQSEAAAIYHCQVIIDGVSKNTATVTILTKLPPTPVNAPTFDVYETKVSARTSVIKEMKMRVEGKFKPTIHYRSPVSKSYTIVMAFDKIDEIRPDGYTATGYGRMWTAGLKPAFTLGGENLTVSGQGSDMGISPIGARGQSIPVQFEFDNADNPSVPWLYFTGLATIDWNNERFANSSGVVFCENMKPIPCAKTGHHTTEQGLESDGTNGLLEYETLGDVYYPQSCYVDPLVTGHRSLVTSGHYYGTYTTRYNAARSLAADKAATRSQSLDKWQNLKTLLDTKWVPSANRE